MECLYCNAPLIWQTDADLNDVYENLEGIATTLLCSECGAVWTGELIEEKTPLKLAVWGNMRSGKDTASDILEETFKAAGLKVYRIAYADAITEIIKNCFEDVLKVGQPKPRNHYQLIGQTFRKLDPMVWINLLNKKIQEEAWSYDVILITDARQENEFQDLSKQGFKHIKINADEDVRINRMKLKGEIIDMQQLHHETEVFCKDLKADYVLNNNGNDLEIFKKDVQKLASELMEVAKYE